MTNPATTITDHLDTWTSAIKAKSSAGRGGGKKQEFYGIKKLRELILELAVRGLLTERNSSDQNDRNWLNFIAKYDKRIQRKELNKTVIFEIPATWRWVYLKEVADYRAAKKIESKDISYDAWILDLEDIEKETGRILAFKKIGETESKSTKASFLAGDVLYGKLRPYLNKVIVAPTNGFCTTEIVPIRSRGEITSEYLRLFLSSPTFVNYANSKSYGVKMPRLGTNDAEAAEVPLPPPAEQHRIVAKVDELMALCDQLEQQQEDSVQTHSTLVQTLLGALTTASDHAHFQQAWQRIASHFDTLFTTESSIDQLKQTILQLAVMGKLVEQNSKEEPASELLKKIDTNLKKRIKEGAIKKQKPLPEIDDEEIPYDPPDGWVWSRMGNLAQYQKGCAFKSEDYLDCGLMITKIKNLTDNDIQNSVYISPERASEFNQYLLCEGDVVMTTVGSWFSSPISAVGRSFLINSTFHNSLLNQNAVRIRPWKELDQMYLFACINSPIFKKYLVQEAQGTANQASITQESIKNFLICVPPREEQRRIASKVDELMTICDLLKASLPNAQTTQLHLADCLVAAAIH